MNDSSFDDGSQSGAATSERPRRFLVGFAWLLFGAFLTWAFYAIWQRDNPMENDSFKEQMMHRKTRTMENVLDGLVRGDLNRVKDSADRMWEIGHSLNWYVSSPLYEDNDEVFRQSTAELIEAAREGDYEAAKESALRLERSCIECHALINRQANPGPAAPPPA